jgi:signal transduction histidine kinase
MTEERGAGGAAIRGRRAWALVAAWWLLIGLVNAGQHYAEHALAGGRDGWAHAAAHSVPWWLLWGAFTPLVAWMVARYDLAAGRRARDLAAHAAAALALTVAHAALYAGFRVLAPTSPADESGWPQLTAAYLGKASLNVFTYAGVAAALGVLALYRRLREREVAAARLEARARTLEAQLSRAQLDALRAQLQPHFLFNTLNAIAVLARRGGAADAATMIGRLSELLRLTMEQTGRPEVPLGDELALLERYVAIQQVRFGARLRVEVHADTEARQALVPHFCLQPLVENALTHGMPGEPGAGHVWGTAAREGSELVVRVRDDGPGPAAAAAGERAGGGRRGLGLANTRSRLEQLHGPAARLTLAPVPGGGTEVVLALPFRAEAAEPAEPEPAGVAGA